MEPWQEPVRGAALPRAAFALSGIDQLRGYGSGLWIPTPGMRMYGVRATQLGSGSIVASMPVTAWLSHPDGAIDAGIMAAAATHLAAWTTVPPRTSLVATQFSYSPIRRISAQSSTLVGRAHVVRAAPYWVYAEGTVEDGEGRVVAGTSGHFLIRPVPFSVPDPPPQFTPVDIPTYSTPDPYERPVAADRYAAFGLFQERGGVGAIQMMIDGAAPRAPLYEMLGVRPVEVSSGLYVSELVTSDWLQHGDGSVHPSPLAAFCGDNCGASTWSLAGPGVRLATLHCSLNFGRALWADGRALRAEARAQWVGDQVIATSSHLYDGDDVVGTGSMSSLVLAATEKPHEPGSRLLATVLFTDIIDSTAHAERSGDAEWRELLARHHEIVRTEIERARGRLVKSTGDGVLATFDSPTAGVQCARAVRDALRRLGLEIRAGLHTGDVEVAGGDVAGIAVHTAARVQAAAGPGEIWVSETVRALSAGSGIEYTDRGGHVVKGIEEELHLYSVHD